ncbi:MAG: efflux RND transporter periplasmic adaptor subunit, partial [Bacteroidia bacterium]
VYVAKADTLSNNVFAIGTIIANEEVTLMPEISGKVTLLNIHEGSAVNKGDLLVKINDEDLQAQLKKSEVQYKMAESTVTREKSLLDIKGISQEEFDAALSQANAYKADMDYVKAQLTKTEIRAPFNGVIGLKSISEGSYITPAVKIASIQQLDPVKIDFSVPEQYADEIHKDDELTFTINGIKQHFSAKIFAIEPKIDYTTRTVQIRAICPNKGGQIFPGAFAEIELKLKQINDAIMVPTEAIVPVLKGKKVYICKNGKAESVKVETGLRTAAKIQITKGVMPGDSVITTGVMQLKQDAPVKAIKRK